MSAIQLNFTLRTSAHCKSVHLLGSWDNYSGQLPLSKDSVKTGGWKGTFRFQNATLKQELAYVKRCLDSVNEELEMRTLPEESVSFYKLQINALTEQLHSCGKKIHYSYTCEVPGERPPAVNISSSTPSTMEELLYAISYNSQLPGATISNVKYTVVE